MNNTGLSRSHLGAAGGHIRLNSTLPLVNLNKSGSGPRIIGLASTNNSVDSSQLIQNQLLQNGTSHQNVNVVRQNNIQTLATGNAPGAFVTSASPSISQNMHSQNLIQQNMLRSQQPNVNLVGNLQVNTGNVVNPSFGDLSGGVETNGSHVIINGPGSSTRMPGTQTLTPQNGSFSNSNSTVSHDISESV